MRGAFGQGLTGLGRKLRLAVIALVAFFAGSAWLFWFLEKDHPAQAGLLDTPIDVLYWWVITCTTVGYGDVSPHTQGGKLVVILVVLAGVSVVTTLVARAGGHFLQLRLEQMRGLGRMKARQGHTLVCGWSDDLGNILQTLVTQNSKVSSADLVLVTDQDADRVNALRSREQLGGLVLVSGDFTSPEDLQRASAEGAASVLVLADQREKSPDSKTLLAVMAVRQLNKEAHVCAEVHEQRFVRYVKDAGADELIDPGAFRRAMAAQILASPGMGNVFYDLLRMDTGAFIGFEELPRDLHGKHFSDLQGHYAGRAGALLVGLVENVGNPTQIKREALREAQKTPDVSHLVTRLREVKQVRPHNPVLCPDPDHVLTARSMAVVVYRQAGGKR
jgi:voltage-gated potassium channel